MTCKFCFPNTIENYAIQENFDALAGLLPFDPPGGGEADNADYDTDYIATTEATSSAAFTDLATVGPSVSINIPQFAFVFFVASVKSYSNIASANATFRIWNSGGNFDLRRSTFAGEAQSPGARSMRLASAHASPLYATGNEQEFEAEGMSTSGYGAPIIAYFNAGAALTAEGFKLQYRKAFTSGAGNTATFSERRLSVTVITPTNA